MEKTFPQFLQVLTPHFVPNVDVRTRRLTPSDIEAMTPEYIQTPIQWEPEACEKLNSVPKVFLRRVVTGIAERAHTRGLTTVTAEFMEEVHWTRN